MHRSHLRLSSRTGLNERKQFLQSVMRASKVSRVPALISSIGFLIGCKTFELGRKSTKDRMVLQCLAASMPRERVEGASRRGGCCVQVQAATEFGNLIVAAQRPSRVGSSRLLLVLRAKSCLVCVFACTAREASVCHISLQTCGLEVVDNFWARRCHHIHYFSHNAPDSRHKKLLAPTQSRWQKPRTSWQTNDTSQQSSSSTCTAACRSGVDHGNSSRFRSERLAANMWHSCLTVMLEFYLQNHGSHDS